jgi:hypothetical protein
MIDSMQRSLWQRMRSVALIAATTLIVSACGGGGSDATGSASSGTGTQQAACGTGCGTTMVSLTDAAGDFDSYLVTVDSISLTRADGTVVQTVPATTQVDFSQLVDLSELISAAQIPAGRYTAAAITLDYSGATIVVDNGSGGVTIPAGNIINGSTNLPLAAPNPTQMTLTLQLPSDAPLVVTAGAVANLALDFNLAASNSISPSDTAPTTVTVNPVLTASLTPDATRPLDIRGPLVSVNTTAGTYLVGLRPFFNRNGTFGQISVSTSANTTYTINGTAYTGSAGLMQLSTLAAGTLTNAQGTLDSSNQTFTATNVVAGSSAGGSTLDSVTGTVLSRAGDTVTLDAGFLLPAGGMPTFQPEVTVTVGSATTVSEQGESGSFGIQDISVGQKAQFFGTLSNPSSGTAALDATAGSVQLLPTMLAGTVTSTASNEVTVDLSSLGGLPPTLFNFSGTGTSSGADASASAYSVAVPAAISIAALGNGVPASFTGFVAPYGSAPPDFTASSLVSYGTEHAVLSVWFGTLSAPTAPFSTLTSSGLQLSAATLAASAQDSLRAGPASINLSTLASGLDLTPDLTASNVQYAIVHAKSRQISTYSTFNDFVTALTSEFNGSNTAIGVAAEGPYTASSGSLAAEWMVVTTND